MGVFDVVKDNVTVKQVMESSGIEFNRNNMCKCPFHKDKTASMKVKPTDKKYYCFGCGEKGDAIDFVAKYYDLTPKEAAMKVASDFGLATDGEMRSPPVVKKVKKSPEQILKEANTRTFRVLSDYKYTLQTWERQYAPKSADQEYDERFLEAVMMKTTVNYWLDILLWGDSLEQTQLIEKLGKDLDKYERKSKEYRRNQRESYHYSKRGGGAVYREC